MTIPAQLDTRWVHIWKALGQPPISPEPLRTRYTEHHILACLEELDTLPIPAADTPALQLAIFYHDVIYNPRASDNEVQSASLARAELGASLPPEMVAIITRLILITDHHTLPTHSDEQLIVDIDLAILGNPPAAFDRYESNIRKEYGHIPDEQFRAGRSKILEHFLSRPRLFHTDHFFRKYESHARINLRRSLAALTTPPKDAS